MNQQDFQLTTGFRPVFSSFPNTKSMAQKCVMPLGTFYSPFLVQVDEIKKGSFPTCMKCKACVCKIQGQRNSGAFICPFCQTPAQLSNNFGLSNVQQSYTGKSGDSGLFFIIDTCISQQQMNALKDTLYQTIQKLPEQLFIGLMIFNKNIMIANFQSENFQYICLNGQQNYQNIQIIQQAIGLGNGKVPILGKFITSKIYMPINRIRSKVLQAISELQIDKKFVPRQNRQKRASGAAIQLAVNLICSLGIHTRFVTLIGGPCTIGPGQVVDLPLKNTIRVYMDIIQSSQNSKFYKSATKFYEALSKTIIDNRCTMDLWSYGLDQFGLVQMKQMVNCSGGLMAMHEQFNHFIFQQSFSRFYQPNEAGLMNFPFATSLRIRVSKQIKINGILGTCKSLKQNTLKTASQMQIGQGKTNQWYLGGISCTNSLCILLSHSQIANSQNKQKGFYIQCITNYKYSDNIARTRVSTIFIPFLRQIQIRQIAKCFDQQAATVMLARMGSRKAEVQDVTQVKKWIDRILLKFCVKFAQFNRGQKASFRLIQMMKQFPQFMYHLRRSGLINPFGCPPDQSIYMKSCLQRQSLSNCIVMIQSALIKYTPDIVDDQGRCQPQSVELDFQQMTQDAVLLMDSYFNVIVWFGDNIRAWKQQKVNQQPQYQYLTQLFQAPMRDASQIMYDRLPISNFYQTFKNDGKQRYLKARVNPSTKSSSQSDGHFVTDDAPINVFMDFLIKSVVNYTQ